MLSEGRVGFDDVFCGKKLFRQFITQKVTYSTFISCKLKTDFILKVSFPEKHLSYF